MNLFEAIGAFLAAHRLSAAPAHYALAYQVLSDPAGPLALAVTRLTDGGVRLTGQDIAKLGGEALAGVPVVDTPVAVPSVEDRAQEANALIARAELQVSGFARAVRSIHEETCDFGRELAASAAAIRQANPGTALDEITALTSAMIDRVRDAERRLAAAERETDALRDALDEARGSARQDPLTELANRRGFDEAFAALPPDTAVVLGLCDIDHFKRVNDQFGHAVGDRVLRAVGQTLAAESEGALVARYGGEEFAFLITGSNVETAQAMLDRARSAVAARRFRTRESDAPIGVITISGGVAEGTARDARDALYARADAALYRAKATGRNRVLRAN